MHDIVDVEPKLRAIGFIELRDDLHRRLLADVGAQKPLADNLGGDAVDEQIAFGIKRGIAQIEIEGEALNVEPPRDLAETAIGNLGLSGNGKIIACDVGDERQLDHQLGVDLAFAGFRQRRCFTHGTNGKLLDRLDEGSKFAVRRERNFRVRARQQHIAV